MMEQMQNRNRQTMFVFVILVPIFLVFSLFLSNWFDGRKMDFAAYWQAGHMILSGQNVYDTEQWIAVRNSEGTALHSEPTFQYPLPLAILFTLPALLPVQISYTVWIFLGQVAILTSIILLLMLYPARTGYFEILAIGGIFFFRPMFSVFNSGQILPLLILLLSLSIRMFRDGRWFIGGILLSIVSLKPSVGFPILILAGIWLLIEKQWKGIWGLIVGGLGSMLIGMLVNYKWIIDYLSISGNSFSKYLGMHPTLWGAVSKIFGRDGLGLAMIIVFVMAVVVVQVYLFWRGPVGLGSFDAFASILPAALLISPYSWNYDQILLVIPILYLLIAISKKYGTPRAALFMFGVVSLAFGMVVVAYWLKHDVWSFANTFVIWLFSVYFVAHGGEDERAGAARAAKEAQSHPVRGVG